jgi:hypothetical protein
LGRLALSNRALRRLQKRYSGLVLSPSADIQSFFDPLTVHNEKTNYVANGFGAGILVLSIFMAFFFWRRRSEVEGDRVSRS